MKYSSSAFLLLFSINCLAQNPNPDLFQTWNLEYVTINSTSTEYTVANIEPLRFPNLRIMNNNGNSLDLDGTGSCNSFGGQFDSLNDTTLDILITGITLADCTYPMQNIDHNDFENSYFQVIDNATTYEINNVTGGQQLILNAPNSGIARFNNFVLESEKYNLGNIEIHPNPSNSKIYIKVKNAEVIKIEVFNLLGELVVLTKNNFESIDISHLKTGVYITKIHTPSGFVSKKIVKK